MTARSVDRAVESYARRQHGVFHHRQALHIGATPGIIRRRLAAGTWVRLADSLVLALPSHPGTWLRQAMAATLSVPASAVSGPAAAALHGYPGFPRARMEIMTRGGGGHRSPFADVRRSDTIGRLTVVEGIRVVSQADCMIQLASYLAGPRLETLVGELAAERRSFLDDLRERYVAVAQSRLPGIGSLRDVLDTYGEGETPPRNELERQLRHLLGSLPAGVEVLWEHTPHWYEPGEARVDALVPAWNLIVEGDGRRWHTRVADFESDRWRDNLAQAHGYDVLRFTWRRMTTEPNACRNLLAVYASRSSGLVVPETALVRPNDPLADIVRAEVCGFRTPAPG